jgi:transcriptional regulator with XRE-family HTH domain
MAKKFILLDKQVGVRLREARLRAGFTQKQAAEVFGADSNTLLTRWESLTDEPQIGALISLAKAYGVSIDWLLTGEEAPPKPSTLSTDPAVSALMADFARWAEAQASQDQDFLPWLRRELSQVKKRAGSE